MAVALMGTVACWPNPPPNAAFGVNGGGQVTSDATTQATLRAWGTPIVRVGVNDQLSDSGELANLQAIKNIGAVPMFIVHGAADPNVATDDPHLAGLVHQIFGDTLVYIEFGNEEDCACGGLSQAIPVATYTSTWNSVIGGPNGLKATYPTYKFVGPVAAYTDTSYIAAFVANANPTPDVVSWHDYSCGSSDSNATCLDFPHWARDADAVHGAELAATGRAWPYIISEWNLDPFGETRYSDAGFMAQYVAGALNEFTSLVTGGDGLLYAIEFAATGSFHLINSNDTLSPEGQAWQETVVQVSGRT
jgi:hypothetical protein